MTSWVHRLADIDLVKMTAVCASCGPVGIKKAPAMKSPKCRMAMNSRSILGKKRYEQKKKLKVKRGPNCEICKIACKTVYDHCHEKGNFRGWLCNKCNIGLGFMNDNPSTLRAAANYLER